MTHQPTKRDANKRPNYLRWFGYSILAFALGSLVAIVAFVGWALMPSGALLPQTQTALQSNRDVRVTDARWFAFTPTHTTPDTGLILYPGGKVPSEAYAPLSKQIADAGYLVVVVKVPLNFAIFDVDAPNQVREAYTSIDTWVVGGHSLGGSAATLYALDNPVDGVVLYASYPTGDEFKSVDVPVVSIYGTNDGIATLDETVGAADQMPPQTEFVAIEGGNHSQFAYYGTLGDDTAAAISLEEQIAQSVDATIRLLEQVSE